MQTLRTAVYNEILFPGWFVLSTEEFPRKIDNLCFYFSLDCSPSSRYKCWTKVPHLLFPECSSSKTNSMKISSPRSFSLFCYCFFPLQATKQCVTSCPPLSVLHQQNCQVPTVGNYNLQYQSSLEFYGIYFLFEYSHRLQITTTFQSISLHT